MRRTAALVLLGCVMAVGGCDPYGYIPPAPPPPVPLRGPAALDWRALVGCYRMEGRYFAFDTVPAAPSPYHPRVQGGRRAGWLPHRQRVGDSFWWITPRNAVEFIEDDGLHGGIYEFVVRGDSLVGRVHTLTDILGVYPPVVRAAAVRAPCPADGAGRPPSGELRS